MDQPEEPVMWVLAGALAVVCGVWLAVASDKVKEILAEFRKPGE